MNSVWLQDRYLSHKEIKFADDEGKIYESETPILYLVAKENSVSSFNCTSEELWNVHPYLYDYGSKIKDLGTTDLSL